MRVIRDVSSTDLHRVQDMVLRSDSEVAVEDEINGWLGWSNESSIHLNQVVK